MPCPVPSRRRDRRFGLIDQLTGAEPTPCTPDVSPFGSARRSFGNRKSAPTLESPLTHYKRIGTATGSPLRAALLNRASTTSSVASIRPYAGRKATNPRSGSALTETREPRSGNEHLVGQQITPWEDLNWNASSMKKVKAQGSRHAFRNVLQPSSSGTTTAASWSRVGASGSSWGSAGTGTGGAKYQSSSKFYHGYQVSFRHQLLYLILNARFVPRGAGRILTQVGQASAIDSGLNQTDDTEDPLIRPRPITSPARRLTGVRRPRSHSLILASQGQVDDAETRNRSGILEVVRIHVRASHAFAPHNRAVNEVVTDATLDALQHPL